MPRRATYPVLLAVLVLASCRTVKEVVAPREIPPRSAEKVVDLARTGFGVKKSSVSRGFVRASADEVRQLAERRFDHERFAVIFIDAQPYAGEMMVVALGVTAAGTGREALLLARLALLLFERLGDEAVAEAAIDAALHELAQPSLSAAGQQP